MDMKELRLGNLVNVDRMSHVIPYWGQFPAWVIGIPGEGRATIDIALPLKPGETITDEQKRDVGFKADRNFDDLHPIALTPEWLEIFGYHLNAGDHEDQDIYRMDDHSNNYFYFPWMQLHIDWEGECGGSRRAEVQEVEYVHQLQNLFHAITGRELAIKEVPNA